MIRSIILSFGLLLIVGCGAQSSPDEGDSTVSDSIATLVAENNDSNSVVLPAVEGNETLVTDVESEEAPDEDLVVTEVETEEEEPVESILPPKINIDFPTLLKEDPTTTESNLSEANETLVEQDLGYLQLKKSITKIDRLIDLAEINVAVLNQIMPEVQQRCEGMLSCLFKAGTLSIVMDNETMAKVDAIVGDTAEVLLDQNKSEVSFGELGFSTYDTNESYQYGLTLDVLHTTLYKENPKRKRELQSMKWSADNRDVLTTYDYEDNESNQSITLHYMIDEEGKETMHVYNRDKRETEGYQENTSLVLSKVEDDQNLSETNGSYTLTANSILKQSTGDDVNISSFSSNIEIDENRSLLLFSGSMVEESSGDEVAVSSELTCENNESCEENATSLSETVDDEVVLYELRIVGGNLKDGDYLLLPPDTTYNTLDMATIFEESLGGFTVMGDERQGALHSEAFLYLLNSLVIVYLDPSQESQNMFEIVSLEDKPTLRIIK